MLVRLVGVLTGFTPTASSQADADQTPETFIRFKNEVRKKIKMGACGVKGINWRL